MEVKISNFLSTLFWNEDLISQESLILADSSSSSSNIYLSDIQKLSYVENINFWSRIEIFSRNEHSC